ncbi:hypothetical protein V8F06_006399 [Rhypophila decipiens]
MLQMNSYRATVILWRPSRSPGDHSNPGPLSAWDMLIGNAIKASYTNQEPPSTTFHDRTATQERFKVRYRRGSRVQVSTKLDCQKVRKCQNTRDRTICSPTHSGLDTWSMPQHCFLWCFPFSFYYLMVMSQSGINHKNSTVLFPLICLGSKHILCPVLETNTDVEASAAAASLFGWQHKHDYIPRRNTETTTFTCRGHLPDSQGRYFGR